MNLPWILSTISPARLSQHSTCQTSATEHHYICICSIPPSFLQMAAKVPPKTRSEKLRTACDSCYNSKVKCSRSRPLCSRCLICGTDCVYSPSGRSGRKSRKAEEITAFADAVLDGDEALQFHHDATYFLPISTTDDTQISVHATPILQPTLDSYLEYSQFECIDPMLLMSTQVASSSIVSATGILSFDPSSWLMDISISDPSVLGNAFDASIYSRPAFEVTARSTLGDVYYSPELEHLAPVPDARQSVSDQHYSEQSAVWQYTST